jgi:hypothetical protein
MVIIWLLIRSQTERKKTWDAEMLADHFWQGDGEEEAPSPMSKKSSVFYSKAISGRALQS